MYVESLSLTQWVPHRIEQLHACLAFLLFLTHRGSENQNQERLSSAVLGLSSMCMHIPLWKVLPLYVITEGKFLLTTFNFLIIKLVLCSHVKD